MPQEKKLTKRRRRAFLDALTKNGNVSACAAEIGVGRTWLYAKREEHPDFGAEWDDAYVRWLDTCASIAARRATIGEDVLVRTTKTETDAKGTVIATTQTEEIRVYKSDRLLAQLLDRRHPEYRAAASRREVTGLGGRPIPITPIPAGATEEEAVSAYLELVRRAAK